LSELTWNTDLRRGEPAKQTNEQKEDDMEPKKYTHAEAVAIIKKYGSNIKPATVLARLNRQTMTEEQAATTPVMSAKEAGRKGGSYSSWQRSFK